MKNKEPKNILEVFELANRIALNGYFGIFGGLPQPKIDENDLKNGFRLVPLTEKDKKFSQCYQNKKQFDNSNNYSYLYKDGVKISDVIFRKGGLCHGFKDGYCALIQYSEDFKFGRHCLVDETGKIVLSETSSMDKLYHLKGIIASMNGKIYNLKTGEILLDVNSKSINSEYFLFVENKYSFSSKFELGVYKINYYTGEVEIFK